MPQLDTIFILMIYLWTWVVLFLLSQKMEAFAVSLSPKKQHMTTNKPTPTLPWT